MQRIFSAILVFGLLLAGKNWVADQFPATHAAASSQSAGQIAYAAALQAIARGKTDEALQLFRRAAETSLDFNKAHRSYVQSLITSPGQLQAALPRSFPQYLYWVEHFETSEPELFEAWVGSFAAGAAAALEELTQRVASGRMLAPDALKFLRRFGASRLLMLDDGARRHFDQACSVLFSGVDPKYSAFCAARSHRLRIPLIKAWTGDRLSGEASSGDDTQLFGWHADRSPIPAALFRFGPPLGFAISREVRDALVVVESRTPLQGSIEASHVAWSASDANETYWTYNGCVLLATFQYIKTQLVYQCAGALPPFLKIQITGGTGRTRLEQTLAAIVQVYE